MDQLSSARGEDSQEETLVRISARVCLRGAGTLNHSSICLRAKLFPKTPALSFMWGGEKHLLLHCQQGQGKETSGLELLLAALVPGACRALEAAGCDSPPSLAAFRASEPLPAPLGCRCRLRERLWLCCSEREPFRHPAPAHGAASFRRVTLCVLPDLICVTCGCCQPSDWLLKPADVVAPGLPGRWVGFALSLDD